jgi:hypothetical protein
VVRRRVAVWLLVQRVSQVCLGKRMELTVCRLLDQIPLLDAFSEKSVTPTYPHHLEVAHKVC